MLAAQPFTPFDLFRDGKCFNMSEETQTDNVQDDVEEKLHFQKVVNSFRSYKKNSITAVHRREEYLNKLPIEHQKLLRKHGYQDTLDDLKQAVEKNMEVVNHILLDVDGMFENVSHQKDNKEIDPRVRPTPMDMEKVQSTIKQIVRDWSSAGAEERAKCYEPLLAALDALHPDNNRHLVKVLVPGSGLGRLAWEIARRGYECQGSEFSLYMLFASNFLLNKAITVDGYRIHPYIHEFCNNKASKDQLREISFPDVDASSLPEDAKFSMAAGDFVDVYSAPEYVSSQDCVVTCFFIDCAHNILQFVQVIHRVLKSGGVWINLGPLLYHFSDVKGEDSIEPDYTTLKAIIKDLGFEFIEEKEKVETTYSQNATSMLQYTYNCVMFSAKKM